MSELFPLLIVLFIWAFVSGSSKGSKQKKAAGSKPGKVSPKKETAAVPLPEEASAKTQTQDKAGPVPEEAHAPIQPTVHVTPHDHSDMFAGSMEADREEYIRQDMPSAVSETFFTEEEEPAPPAEVSPMLPLLNAGTLKQAFVLQEILTRPVDRHR